jgi:hypothetical protein
MRSVTTRRYHRFSRHNSAKTSASDADLRCEEAIMKDKELFGRTRTSLMKYLRAEYGSNVADRALARINKRRTEGYSRKQRMYYSFQDEIPNIYPCSV